MLYCGPRQEKEAGWVPAVVTKVFDTRSVNVRVFPRGGTWRRHIEQLRPNYGTHEDADPGGDVSAAPVEPFLGSPTNEVATSMPDTQVPLLPTEEAKITAQPVQRYLAFPLVESTLEITQEGQLDNTTTKPLQLEGYRLSVINGGL